MQDLHRNFAPGRMHRGGDEPVFADLFHGRQLGGVRRHTAGLIGGDAAGDDQAGTAGRPFGIKHRQALEAVGRFLETRVHRPHQDPIFEGDTAKLERGQHVWIGQRVHKKTLQGISAAAGPDGD